MRDSSKSELFDSPPPSAPAAPASSAKASQLKVLPPEKGQLNPAQQRFNKLLAKVDKLGHKLQDFERLADKVRGPHLARVAEVERQTVEGQRQMVLFLHERLQRKGLTAAQQKTARAILKSLLHQHMQMGMDVDIDDPAMMELRALYKVEEEAELQNKALCDEALDMAQDVLGDALDRETLKGFETTEEVLEALLEQVRAHEETEQERQAARRAKRPATERQRQAQAQEQDAKAALRSIYRQLASALHPDRETDAAERERKSALMVQANTAYERGDLTALLHLQLQAEQVDAEHIARMADDKLAALSLLLKQQVATLERQLMEAEMRLSSELGVVVRASMKESAVLHLLMDEAEMHTHWLRQVHTDLERVREDDAQLKRWLREQADFARQQAKQEAFFAHLGGIF